LPSPSAFDPDAPQHMIRLTITMIAMSQDMAKNFKNIMMASNVMVD
jgi:hypothetical protein